VSTKQTAPSRDEAEKPARAEAAYLRIARIVSEQIHSGEYQPGGQLPNERQLAKEFGVSLMTLRRAMQVLAERGLTSSQQGRGTFVRSLELGQAVFGLHQWSEQWTRETTQVKLLEASSRPASELVARMLRCKPGERTLFLRRLVLRDSEPITYNWEHLVFDPRRPLVETQLRITSLEGLLQSAAGSALSAGRLKIRAHTLTPEEARLLQESDGAAALCLEHLFTDVAGSPISWGCFLCKADVFWLETAVGSCDETQQEVVDGPS
jgi:GntR family transcriptional regulator